MRAVIIQKLREFILTNEQPIKSAQEIFALILSVSMHIIVLYLWIFKAPLSLVETLNFKHMVLELIQQIEQNGIKQYFQFIVLIVSTMSISIIAILGSLILCCRGLIRRAGLWSAALLMINIITLMLCLDTTTFILIVNICVIYWLAIKHFLIEATKRESINGKI